LAGGIAVPSGCSCADPVGDVGVVCVVEVVPPGIPPVWAIAGTAPTSEVAKSNSARPVLVKRVAPCGAPSHLRVFDRKPLSFVGLRG
jgi:hypothetical protein